MLFPLLIVLILPLYVIKIPLGIGGSLPVLDVSLVLLILVAFGIIYRKHQWYSLGKFLIQRQRLFLLVGLFILLFTLSWMGSFPSDDWQSGLGILKSYIVLPSILAMLLGFFASDQTFSPLSFWRWYGWYTTLLSLLSILAILFHKVTFDGRVSLWFESPNHLAMALGPGLLVWFFFLLKNTPFQKKLLRTHPVVLLGLVILHTVALLQTYSLGAFLATGVLAIVLLVPNKSFLLRFSSVVFYSSIASLCVILLLPLFLRLTNYRAATPASSTDSRLMIYQVAGKIIQDRWISGIGPGQFQRVYLSLQPTFPPYPQWAVPHAHNLLLHLWTEGGLLTFVSLLWIIYISLTIKQKEPTPANALSLILLCYFLLHGLVDTPNWKNDQAILWWILLLS